MAKAGPPGAIQQIESAGVKVITISGSSSVDGAKSKITQVTKILNAATNGEALIKKLNADSILEHENKPSRHTEFQKLILRLFRRDSLNLKN